MEEEMHSFNKNNTWVIVPKPQGVKTVAYKWLSKIKEAILDEKELRYKSRLVVRGFT